MRALLIIPCLILSYLLLSGWPNALEQWSRAILVFITLCVGLHLSKKREKKAGSTFPSPTHLSSLDWITTSFVLLTITLVTSLYFAKGPQLAEASIERFVPEKRELSTDQFTGAATQSNSLSQQSHGNWLWNSQYQRTLAKRSNHTPKNKPEIYLSTSSASDAQKLDQSRMYIRSFALNHFDGVSWSIHRPTKRKLSALTNKPITFSKRALIPQLPSFEYTITHSYYQRGQNIFSSLQGARSTQLPHLTRISDAIFLLPPPSVNSDGYSYQAISQPLLFERLPSSASLTLPKINSLATVHYKPFPDLKFRKRMQGIIRPLNREPNLHAKLSGLRDLLRKRCRYSLRVDNPSNLDPLENFLFAEKAGYCEHFASATALLCRQMGIPSRIAFGWSGGRFYPASNLFVFLAKDAHAWTEIYLEGYGWVIFDTTAPDLNDNSPAEPGETPPPLNEPEVHSQNEPENLPQQHTPIWKYVSLTTAACLLTLIIILLLRRYQPQLLSSPHNTESPSAPPSYLQDFHQACISRNFPQPPSRTLRQHLNCLEKTDAPPTFSELLLHYHYGVTYQRKDRDKSIEKRLRKEIRSWRSIPFSDHSDDASM